MNSKSTAKKTKGGDGSPQNLKTELSRYVTEQPRSIQRIHQCLTRLTAASVAVPVALLTRALYLSFSPQGRSPAQITACWFIAVASGALPFLVEGLHSIVLRAFPAQPILGLASQLTTGSGAVATGVGLVLAVLAGSAFWGTLAYAVATPDWALLDTIIRVVGAVAGAGAVLAVVQSLYRQLIRSL